MLDISQLSKEEREAILNERIEAIRRKNEDIMRRYQEIESDKQNADSLSKEAVTLLKVQPKESTTPAVRRVSSAGSESRAPRKVTTPAVATPVDSGYRPTRLSEADLPPPDPHFSFLSDRLREGALCAPLSPPSRKRSTASNSSVASRSSYGSRKVSTASNSSVGSDISTGSVGFSNYKPPAPRRRYGTTKGFDLSEHAEKLEVLLDEVSRQQYEQWSVERQQIDRERVNRQKQADGKWNRDWDKQKLTVEDKPKSRQTREISKGTKKTEDRSTMSGNWRQRQPIAVDRDENNNIIEEANQPEE